MGFSLWSKRDALFWQSISLFSQDDNPSLSSDHDPLRKFFSMAFALYSNRRGGRIFSLSPPRLKGKPFPFSDPFHTAFIVRVIILELYIGGCGPHFFQLSPSSSSF